MRECTDFPDRTAMFKVCAACGATVDRKDCHKNRYAEYICRNCSSAGIKFTWRRRLWCRARLKLRKLLRLLPVAGLVLLLVWVSYEVLLA